jgi:hypothetical protein
MKMRLNSGKKRLVALILGIAMMAAVTGLAVAETVTVDLNPRIAEAYAEYGVDEDTLAKASADLNASERRALQAIYGDSDIRGSINGVVLQELWNFIDDDDTIATITLAGRVYRTGSPDAF